MLPAFFIIGITFIPIGVGLFLLSNKVCVKTNINYYLIFLLKVYEIEIDYTDCHQFNDPGKSCIDILQNASKYNDKDRKVEYCECRVTFTLTQNVSAPVFLYYGLSRFYQNHRRYVKSRDDHQLEGDSYSKIEDLNKNCEPFRTKDKLMIAPCGAIANSFFTDTFTLYLLESPNFVSSNKKVSIQLLRTGIAWPTDKQYKFKNPSSWANTISPPNWDFSVTDLDPTNKENNGYQNENLIVWMRTAALPTFRKLWARINHDEDSRWRYHLPRGKYLIDIKYR